MFKHTYQFSAHLVGLWVDSHGVYRARFSTGLYPGNALTVQSADRSQQCHVIMVDGIHARATRSIVLLANEHDAVKPGTDCFVVVGGHPVSAKVEWRNPMDRSVLGILHCIDKDSLDPFKPCWLVGLSLDINPGSVERGQKVLADGYKTWFHKYDPRTGDITVSTECETSHALAGRLLTEFSIASV